MSVVLKWWKSVQDKWPKGCMHWWHEENQKMF